MILPEPEDIRKNSKQIHIRGNPILLGELVHYANIVLKGTWRNSVVSIERDADDSCIIKLVDHTLTLQLQYLLHEQYPSLIFSTK